LGGTLDALATFFLGTVGLWIGNSYRRHMRATLSVRAVEAYARLWEITAIANHKRTVPLTEDDRLALADAMVEWYFNSGDGMFMPTPTRKLFFAIVDNLGLPVAGMHPKTVTVELARQPALIVDARRGCMCAREMSILRTQLKSDLTIYLGATTFVHLRSDERELLKECNVRPTLVSRIASAFSSPSRTKPFPCLCGLCPS
jgi:hypothetical protein